MRSDDYCAVGKSSRGGRCAEKCFLRSVVTCSPPCAASDWHAALKLRFHHSTDCFTVRFETDTAAKLTSDVLVGKGVDGRRRYVGRWEAAYASSETENSQTNESRIVSEDSGDHSIPTHLASSKAAYASFAKSSRGTR